MTTPFSRRRLLGVALAGAGLSIGLGSRQAHAFSTLEESDAAHLLALRQTACGGADNHQKLVDEVNRVLGDKYDPQQKKEVVSALTCPICGCPLAGLF